MTNFKYRLQQIISDFLIVGIMLFTGLRANAAGFAVQAGDLLLANYSGNSLLWITPSTGEEHNLGSYLTPTDLAMNTNGHLFISQWNGIITRLDLRTGVKTVVNPGTRLRQVWGLALGIHGEIYVTSGASNQIVRVETDSGMEKVVSEGGELNRPIGIATWETNYVVVTSLLNNRLLRVRLSDGAQEVLAQGSNGLDQPWGVDVNGTDIFLTAYDRKEIQRWRNGQVNLVATLDGFPYGLAVKANEIVSGISGIGDAVVRLTPSGTLIQSYSGGSIKQVTGIEIAPVTISLGENPEIHVQSSEQVEQPFQDDPSASVDSMNQIIQVPRNSTNGFFRVRSSQPIRLSAPTISSNAFSFKYQFQN